MFVILQSVKSLKFFLILRTWVDDSLTCVQGAVYKQVRYFYNSTRVDYSDSLKYCQNHNATLFGMNNGGPGSDFSNIISLVFGASFTEIWVLL